MVDLPWCNLVMLTHYYSGSWVLDFGAPLATVNFAPGVDTGTFEVLTCDDDVVPGRWVLRTSPSGLTVRRGRCSCAVQCTWATSAF